MSVIDGHPLSNTVGAVLDPIVSLRRRVRLAPGASARVTFSTLIAPFARRSARPGRRVQHPATFERAAPWRGRRPRSSYTISALDPDEAYLFQSSPPTCLGTYAAAFRPVLHEIPGPRLAATEFGDRAIVGWRYRTGRRAPGRGSLIGINAEMV